MEQDPNNQTEHAQKYDCQKYYYSQQQTLDACWTTNNLCECKTTTSARERTDTHTNIQTIDVCKIDQKYANAAFKYGQTNSKYAYNSEQMLVICFGVGEVLGCGAGPHFGSYKFDRSGSQMYFNFSVKTELRWARVCENSN